MRSGSVERRRSPDVVDPRRIEPVGRVIELASANWKTTVAREDVRTALDENVFRRASLA